MTARKPVGLIGIGLLGQAFAHRLLDALIAVVGPAKDVVATIGHVLLARGDRQAGRPPCRRAAA